MLRKDERSSERRHILHKITLSYCYKDVFQATYLGKVIATSAQPEFEACRYLLAHGITGKLETWWEGASHPAMILDIEKAANLTVGSNSSGAPIIKIDSKEVSRPVESPLALAA